MKTKMINWNASKDEQIVIHKIALRAVKEAHKFGMEYTLLDASMDIAACHLNGNPLDLDKLLHADSFNFHHDAFGIRRNVDRTTGKIENFFSPRCSKRGGR
jgi:hypothetical protein